MAKMKFLCDAERCIECNGCVTACKNEHEVPWGVNRRRVITLGDGEEGEKSISVACMHCTDAPCAAVCPVDCFYTTGDGVVLHDKDLYLSIFTPVRLVHRNIHRKTHLVCAEKWISAHSVPVVLKKIIQLPRLKSMVAIVWPKASYHFVQKCVQPKPCLLVTATWLLISTASEY